jgi:ABC-type dipeptide/oligopeptide/nickel transport system ATPase component
MKGKNVVIVGESGAGKTTYLKNIGTTKPKIICSIDTEFPGAEFYTSFNTFLQKAERVSDTMLIIDEANHYLKYDTEDKRVTTLMMRARKYNNIIIFSFHALRQIPTWLLVYTNNLLRFKTTEHHSQQAQRFKDFPYLAADILKQPVIERYKYHFLPIS